MANKEADDIPGDTAKQSSSNTELKKMENWMENLPEHLHDVPLHRLFIPGSHNSGTDQLKKEWEVGPDADQAVRTLSALPMAKTIIHSWSRCQTLSVGQQLQAGVRYLDLRVAHRQQGEELRLVHTLYGPTVAACVEEVKAFLSQHKKEVVLLDFNHFYSMELEHHIQLITYLMYVFDGMLSPYSSPQSLTLKSLVEKNTRVVIFYGHSSVMEFPDLWPPHSICSVWSNTMNVDKCLAHQEAAAQGRCEDVFHVCQAVLTPGTGDIMQKMGSSLYLECAKKINHRLPDWMRRQGVKGCQGMVLIADFVQEGDFLRKVIELNK